MINIIGKQERKYKNEEYKEMKKENNYISTDMNHKKLIFGVVIIHVCFMLIGASGIISTLKEKNIFMEC